MLSESIPERQCWSKSSRLVSSVGVPMTASPQKRLFLQKRYSLMGSPGKGNVEARCSRRVGSGQ